MCRSRFYKRSKELTLQIMPSSRPPRFTVSHRHLANYIDPCRERRVGNSKAFNHADSFSTVCMPAAASWAASRCQQRLARRCKKVRLRCLSKLAAAAHAHSTQTIDDTKRAEVLPTLPPAAQLTQPSLACQPAEWWNRAWW